MQPPSAWSRRRRLLVVIGVVGALAVGSTASYAAVVAHRTFATVALPAPRGTFAVGRSEATVTDRSRHDRALSLWAWYPARPGTGSAAAYAPGLWQGLQLGLPIGESRLDRIHDPAREEARPAGGRFPLVVLEPGLGFSAPQYAVLAEDVASHGYVVVGVTPTGSANLTVLDGRAVHATEQDDPSDFDGDHTQHDEAIADRLLTTWVADARFAATSLGAFPAPADLADHVDADRVAYVGHSFGGAASLQACHDDPHCTAAVDLDGGIFGSVARSGLAVPSLLLGHQDSCITGECTPHTAADRADRRVAETFRAAATGPVRVAAVEGTGHLAFSDYGVYYLALPLRRFLGLGDRDGVDALHETTTLVESTLLHSLLAESTPAESTLAGSDHRRTPAVRIRPRADGAGPAAA